MNCRARRRLLLGCVVSAVLLLVPGCSSSRDTPREGAAKLNSSALPASDVSPYSLYTHCGIREARIGDTYFVADRPLDDGQGNPPPGWGNPYQAGTVTTPSPSVAVFRDSAGHIVRFHARPGATSYLTICS
ncbi:MAG: hypothetical protein QOH14_3363 [Pseudonocardiales bacterium]|nr:hypothetical protein [Pseudonocardiales bacterium]